MSKTDVKLLDCLVCQCRSGVSFSLICISMDHTKGDFKHHQSIVSLAGGLPKFCVKMHVFSLCLQGDSSVIVQRRLPESTRFAVTGQKNLQGRQIYSTHSCTVGYQPTQLYGDVHDRQGNIWVQSAASMEKYIFVVYL